MANTLKPKRSSVAGNIPTTTNLASGELAVNMADQKVWINNGTSVVQVGSGKLSGLADVVLSSLASGQGLSWNGTNWVNSNAGTGTVTSVSGVGTVSGLTLTGSVTGSGSLTLGGTLSLTSANVTTALGFTPYNATNPSGYITSSGSISGSAGSLANDTDWMKSRGSVAAASVDTATSNGFYTQTNVSDSQGILVFNSSGSLGPLQMTFTYGGLMQFRNKTDSTTWTAWKTVLTSANYNSYAPTLTGAGASGTWGISVTGSAGSVAWSGVTSKPTTLSGYGITDAVASSHVGSTGTAHGNATTSVAGFMSSTDKTKLDGVATGATANTGTVTSIVAGTGLSGGTITTSGTIALANTTVTAGSYTNASITVDAQGRITSASSGAGGGGVTSFNTRTGAVTLSSSDVTTALGFTPYNSTNPSGYITSSGSISGSAGSVSGLSLTSSANGVNPDNVTQNQIGYNTSVSLFGQTDGGLYSSAYNSSWIHQIYGDFRTGQIAVRGKNSGTWQAWRTVLDSSNYTSYSPSLTGSGASGTWAISVTGTAVALSSSNYINRTGSSGNLNTDFSNTPAGTQRYQGDDSNLTNSPGGTWWIYEHKRHSNASNVWGTQVAWGWEDNSNRLMQRNVSGNTWSGWVEYLNTSGRTFSGSLTMSGDITGSSDERLKTNWRDMPDNFVARLAQVKVGIYDRLDESDVTQVGVSAQSFQKLLPQAVMTAKDELGTLSVAYGNAALASAVELAKDNVDLRARVAKLESLVAKLIEI